jgi:hypothetical protein
MSITQKAITAYRMICRVDIGYDDIKRKRRFRDDLALLRFDSRQLEAH